MEQKQQTEDRGSFLFFSLHVTADVVVRPLPVTITKDKNTPILKGGKKRKLKEQKIPPPVFHLILYVSMCECILLCLPPPPPRNAVIGNPNT